MANTYTLISSNTLTSSAASVTFSAIPATYTDLVLRVSGRTDQSTTGSGLRLTFNGTNTASNRQLQGSGTAAASASATGGSLQVAGNTNGATSTANIFSSQEIYIPNYTSSTVKPFSTFSVQENNITQAFIDIFANLQNETQTITSIVATIASGNNFVSGSSFYLYGISNA
jgi:hypothetical protein